MRTKLCFFTIVLILFTGAGRLRADSFELTGIEYYKDKHSETSQKISFDSNSSSGAKVLALFDLDLNRVDIAINEIESEFRMFEYDKYSETESVINKHLFLIKFETDELKYSIGSHLLSIQRQNDILKRRIEKKKNAS